MPQVPPLVTAVAESGLSRPGRPRAAARHALRRGADRRGAHDQRRSGRTLATLRRRRPGLSAHGRERPRSRTVVKVCGITRLEDAQRGARGRRRLAGLRRLARRSPRAIDARARAADDRRRAARTRSRCAVMVAPDARRGARDCARASGARRLQLHRVDPAAWPADFPLPVDVRGPGGRGRAARPARCRAPRPSAAARHRGRIAARAAPGAAFPWDARCGAGRARAGDAGRRARRRQRARGARRACGRYGVDAAVAARSRRPGSRTTTGCAGSSRRCARTTR